MSNTIRIRRSELDRIVEEETEKFLNEQSGVGGDLYDVEPTVYFRFTDIRDREQLRIRLTSMRMFGYLLISDMVNGEEVSVGEEEFESIQYNIEKTGLARIEIAPTPGSQGEIYEQAMSIRPSSIDDSENDNVDEDVMEVTFLGSVDYDAAIQALFSIGLPMEVAEALANGEMQMFSPDEALEIRDAVNGLVDQVIIEPTDLGYSSSVYFEQAGKPTSKASKPSPEQRDFKRAAKSSVEEHCSSCDHFLDQSNLDHKDFKGRPVYECPECGMHTVGKKSGVNEQGVYRTRFHDDDRDSEATFEPAIESPRLSGMMYNVNLWGSDPELGNDDHWTADEYVSKEYAMHVYQYPDSNKHFAGDIMAAQKGGSELWVEIDGPGVYEKRQLLAPDVKRRAAADRAELSADRSEYAMQAGMGLGVDAYNDAMGYDTHEPGDGYRHRSAPAGSRYAESKNVNEQSSLYDGLTGPTDDDYARNAPDEEIPEVQIPVEEIRGIRKFAQHWHDGQFSILYRIASSGTMYVGDIYEVESNLDFADNEATVDHSLDDDMGGITWGEVLMDAREEVNALNAKYALQEQLTFGTEEGMEEMETMWALVIGDGSLYGATYDPTGSVLRYWGYNGDDNWAIYELKNVPADIADHVVDHGSMDQVYSDGYQAWDAIKQYAEREPYAMGAEFNPTFAEDCGPKYESRGRTGGRLNEQMAPMGVLGGMKSAYNLEDGMGPGGTMCPACGHVNSEGGDYCDACDTCIVEQPEEIGFAHNFREGTEVDVVLTHTHFGFQRAALIEGLKAIGVGRDKSHNMISELLAGAEVEIGRMDESKAYQVRQVLEEAGFVTEAVEAVSEDYNLNEGYVPSIYKGF